jgi:hypothetical protein
MKQPLNEITEERGEDSKLGEVEETDGNNEEMDEKEFMKDPGDIQQEHLEGLYDAQGEREREIENKME